ncbi:phosphoadenylyl-sulfate reductase [Aliikangiella sp. IMCC44653]
MLNYINGHTNSAPPIYTKGFQLLVNKSLAEYNPKLEKLSAHQRIEWALQHFPGNFALSSSFGIQSAVSLHMVTQVFANIPVIFIDTGYLFAETYQFVEQLTERLKLNLKVFRANLSPAWQEAKYGKLWEQGVSQLEQYNQMNKVEPMEIGLSSLSVNTYFAGLMRSQSSSRKNLPVAQVVRNRLKVHPLIDWNNKRVYEYLKKHHLPYHPLWEKGYVSVGDKHSTRPLSEGMLEEETRFNGVKRECGLHEVKEL